MPSITHTDHSVVCSLTPSPHSLMPLCHLAHRRCQVLSATTSRYWPVSLSVFFVLSGDLGVRIIHRTTDFYIAIKNQTIPNRNCSFFLKTVPKSTNLSQCETITTLVMSIDTLPQMSFLCTRKMCYCREKLQCRCKFQYDQ